MRCSTSSSAAYGSQTGVDGSREFVVTGTPYILPYRVRDGRVEILAVLCASRQWPDQL